MVFGIVTATAICPAIIATKITIEQGQKGTRKAGNKSHNLSLVIRFPGAHPYRDKFEGAEVVLRDGKLYVEHADSRFVPHSVQQFLGRFHPVPEYHLTWTRDGLKGDAFVTTAGTDSDTLYHVYVDSRTHELKYGLQDEAIDHFPGPWSCTPLENRVIFEGWEGFVVVQENEEEDLWALYFDKSDDGLTGEGMVGDVESIGTQRRMLYIRLVRQETLKTMEIYKEEREEAQRLEEELEDDRSAL